MTQITLPNNTSSKTFCYIHYFMCTTHGVPYLKSSSGLNCLVCKRNEQREAVKESKNKKGDKK